MRRYSVEGCTQITGNHHYIFQQDGTPAQDSKTMQNWLKENLTEVQAEEVWLPSSPDCKPFDYFVWGVSELRVKSKSRNKSKDLIQKMKDVMGFLARDILAKACTSFRFRIETLFTADDSFIEYVDCQDISLLIFFTSLKSADFQLCYAI